MSKIIYHLVYTIGILVILPISLFAKKVSYNRKGFLIKILLYTASLRYLILISIKYPIYGILGTILFIIGRRLCVPAITGGIGAGKSTLGKYLSENGFYVIDSDSIGRQFLVSGTAGYRNIVKNFGECVLAPDGEIDKAVLREMVYSDPDKRKLLNKCLHKYIISKIVWDVVKYRILSWQDLIVIEVPLLYETHLSWVCGPIIVCSASEETRLRRCQTRNADIPKNTYKNIMKCDNRERVHYRRVPQKRREADEGVSAIKAKTGSL
ncbi:Dephospho-CoA kinase [Theileria orientalis]|uniref:Dephospho-CoA kinase n=1 Tax=Theileria orientalis TaxID=68886 RepID=A0A976SIJ0_THEOR|nr:Dephospho-CoA kinase [Theileria orientalis]